MILPILHPASSENLFCFASSNTPHLEALSVAWPRLPVAQTRLQLQDGVPQLPALLFKAHLLHGTVGIQRRLTTCCLDTLLKPLSAGSRQGILQMGAKGVGGRLGSPLPRPRYSF